MIGARSLSLSLLLIGACAPGVDPFQLCSPEGEAACVVVHLDSEITVGSDVRDNDFTGLQAKFKTNNCDGQPKEDNGYRNTGETGYLPLYFVSNMNATAACVLDRLDVEFKAVRPSGEEISATTTFYNVGVAAKGGKPRQIIRLVLDAKGGRVVTTTADPDLDPQVLHSPMTAN